MKGVKCTEVERLKMNVIYLCLIKILFYIFIVRANINNFIEMGFANHPNEQPGLTTLRRFVTFFSHANSGTFSQPDDLPFAGYSFPLYKICSDHGHRGLKNEFAIEAGATRV